MSEEYVDRLTALKEMCEHPGEDLFITTQKDIGVTGHIRVSLAGIVEIRTEFGRTVCNLRYCEDFQRIKKEEPLTSNDRIIAELKALKTSDEYMARLLEAIDQKIDAAIAEHEVWGKHEGIHS